MPTRVLALVLACVSLVALASGCACSSDAHRNDAVCVLEHQIVDCTVPAVTSVIPEFLPLVLQVVANLEGASGAIDWSGLEPLLVNMGVRDGTCLLAAAQQALANQTPTAAAARMAAASAGQGLGAVRARKWPGVRAKLPDGSVL